MDSHRDEEEEDDDAWALELDEKLGLEGTKSPVDTAHESELKLEEKPAPASSSELKAKERALAQPSVAATLPQEVLALVISFGQVGRVCKSWSLASVSVARRRFSSRLMEILSPLDPNTVTVALDVEVLPMDKELPRSDDITSG
ncbi:hypothetical protein PR002_g27360 [Phytophthora rubi]|uniref:F-box domain-containing protein n=1 Tax=Phytophthora rubi TaxID=129364 RepID=A0A6A3HLS6_9STRA|nr:hypothetical protein PR002_g27360 [Phytophthora rubi]